MWCGDPSFDCVKYGDRIKIELRVDGHTLREGKLVGYLDGVKIASEPSVFTVVGGQKGQAVGSSAFLLADDSGNLLSMDRYLHLQKRRLKLFKPNSSLHYSTLRAGDRINIWGGRTSRKELQYGSNFVYFDTGYEARWWVFENNKIQLHTQHYFKRECHFMNLVQLIFIREN